MEKKALIEAHEVDRLAVLDETEKKIHFVGVQDVEDIIENNKALQTVEQRSDWGRHIASIPNVIVEQWLSEEWARGNTTMTMSSPEFKELLRRKLQDRDWLFLRTDLKTQKYV